MLSPSVCPSPPGALSLQCHPQLSWQDEPQGWHLAAGRLLCHPLLIPNLKAPFTAGEGPSSQGNFITMPLTTSLIKLFLYLPFKTRLEKVLFPTPVTFPPCFVFSQGCASPSGVQGRDRQGWALPPGCLEVAELCTEQICAALQVSHAWALGLC